MSDTAVREHDGIKWFPRVTVEKYSPDQTAYAERRLLEELSWGRRLLVRQFGIRVPRLHGSWLREIFAAPEDGYAYSEGNQLVNNGLTNLINLLIGATPSGAAGRPLLTNTSGTTPSSAGVGVGNNNTAWANNQTALGADGTANAWYQIMDQNFPSLTTPNIINGQSTFGSTIANFAWNEWCWISGVGALTAGDALASIYATGGETAMVNRKVTVLGTKGTGASWVFSTTITFS